MYNNIDVENEERRISQKTFFFSISTSNKYFMKEYIKNIISPKSANISFIESCDKKEIYLGKDEKYKKMTIKGIIVKKILLGILIL